MVTAEAATLADALAAIGELKTLIQKQAQEIVDLKAELAAAKSEIAALKSETATLKAENVILKSENAALKAHNAKLKYESASLKRQIFRSKSERFLPGFEAEVEVEPEAQTVAEHARKAREKSGREQIPEDIPREDRVIDLPAEKRQGMVLIGYVDSERLAIRSGLYVIRYRRARYAGPEDVFNGVPTTPAPGIISTARAAEPNSETAPGTSP